MPVTNAAMIQSNTARWGQAKVTRTGAFPPVAKKLAAPAAKTQYQAVTAKTHVPWHAIAVTHQRECSQSWAGSLAQGDPWNKKSVHVPAGRGPFKSWEDCAVDALMNCAPYAGRWNDWSVGGTLTLLEKYNGVGYAAKGRPSPYIWSGTDQYQSGKYVRDGVYDPNTIDVQLGCAGLIKAMMEIDPSIRFGQPVVNARPTELPPKEIIKDASKTERKARTGAAGGATAGAGNEAMKTGTEVPKTPLLPSPVAYGMIGVAVCIIIIASVLIARKTKAVHEIW